jgi:hypothetical protein
MDNPTTLLVAIMFVTIVVTGLVNILMFLSNLVAGEHKTDALHASWITLLLVFYLNFFWQTTFILEIEGWDFLSFVGFIIGPIILLFATNLLVAAPEAGELTMPDRHHFELSGRFFFLLLLVQIWTICLDITLDSVSNLTWLAGLMGLVLIVLVISRNYTVHLAGAVLAWIALVTRTILQTL